MYCSEGPNRLQSKDSLSYVFLANNNLAGPVPEDWTDLVHLGTLGLAFNNLDGEISDNDHPR